MKEFDDDDIEILGSKLSDDQKNSHPDSEILICKSILSNTDDEKTHVNACIPCSDDNGVDLVYNPETGDFEKKQRPVQAQPVALADIEIKENKGKPNHKRLALIAILIVLAVLIATILLLLPMQSPAPESPAGDLVEPAAIEVVEPVVAEPAPEPVEITSITPIEDTINDVDFTIYPVGSLKCSVGFDFVDADNKEHLLLTTASDVRADNYKILGDFIHNREQLARGQSKKGYCYVSPDGVVSIGMGDAEDVKARALAEGGTFFRQYPLVMEGEIVPCALKGKSKRRAIGFLNGEPVIVFSKERESIYDFSQALADYGFSHVLYLPGGDGNLHLVTPDGITHTYHLSKSPESNYLIFSRR